MNRTYVHILYSCLNEPNMWMFSLMLAYMCFSCGDLDSVQVAFIKVA